MPDWTRSMEQTYEFYKVNPDTWQDNQRLDNIISCKLSHYYDIPNDCKRTMQVDIDVILEYGNVNYKIS